MGRRKTVRQAELFIGAAELAAGPGHPFYERLNAVLEDDGFDRYVEGLCERFYSAPLGRPSLPPGVYFRCLLTGYFEGLSSEREIAWRIADSLSLRAFVGYSLTERTVDHSTISRNRRLIDVESHEQVFVWILKALDARGLVDGRSAGVDATTLEANAAMRSIVMRDTGESYQDFLSGLARASGISTPTRSDLVRLDRHRKKTARNKEWENPHDPDARITKMKDGRTHLAYKPEHAVDLGEKGHGAVLAVVLHGADQGDTSTIARTVNAAQENLAQLSQAEREHELAEVVADKGYHSNLVMTGLVEMGLRSYVSEPRRRRRDWTGRKAEQQAVYANRRRIRGNRGRRLVRRRSEYVERPFAHCYETGGLRRVWLRGTQNIQKRLCVHAGAFNLGILMRSLTGRGTPRGLLGRLIVFIWLAIHAAGRRRQNQGRYLRTSSLHAGPLRPLFLQPPSQLPSTTGC